MFERMIGAALLRVPAYEEVERDEGATVQALIVVVLAAIASGIAILAQAGAVGFLGGILTAIVAWILYAAVAYFIGTRLFATEGTAGTVGELLRTLGFAQAPGILLVLGVIPILGALVGLVVFFWILATTIVAIRQALDFTTGRAIGTAVVSWLIYVTASLLLAGLFL